MKLLRCYVKAFGGLKDYKVDFNEGLNVFKEDNGFGKSTLTYFIKSMFYGLNNDKKRSINENERAHFKPWNWSGTFGGYLDFEYKGTEFRIERSFGAKEGEDSLLLVNLKTGKTNSNFDDLGSKIFGIDEAGFFSTAYFSEKDIMNLPRKLYEHLGKNATLITGNYDFLHLGYRKFRDSGFKQTYIPYVYEK